MCQSCIPRIPSDMAKAEAFAGQMISIINNGALSTMISIGHRTRLFDIMDRLPSSTSQEIAECAGLNERYVREWLGAMVTGKIIEYQAESSTYYLPPENAILLTRKSNEKNMAAIASMLPVWSGVENQIVECFEKGGGVPYSEFGRFHEVMGEISNANVGNNFTEFVINQKAALYNKLQAGIKVLDIGCGDGQITMKLAADFPNSKFIGIDICEEPIESAARKADALGLENVTFQAIDLLQYDASEQFDLITAFDVIHDLAFPAEVLALNYDWLSADGLFLMMDINASSHLDKNLENPFAPFLYTASTMHCMTVSLAQGGAGLGTVWGKEKAVEMLKAAGFRKIEIENYEHDILNNYYFCSK